MGRRERTVTAMGLPAREEAELMRLLAVVSEHTRARWSFLEAIDADVAFCDPRSALARVFLHHRGMPGVPVCVALGEHGSGQPWPHRLSLPLAIDRLRELLDAIDDDTADVADVADALSPHATGDAPTVVDALAVGAEVTLIDPVVPEGVAMDIDRGEVVDFGHDFIEAMIALRHRMHDTDGVWRMEWGGRAFDAFFPEGSYRYDGEAGADVLIAMAVNMPVGPARRLEPAEAVSARHVGHQKPLDPLLWRIGLHMPERDAMPWSGDRPVRLRRWPDFGHLGAHRPHIAIAEHMSRAPWRAADLARASGQSIADVRAFFNACGLCGLLEMLADDTEPPLPPASTGPEPGVSRLLRRLRDALGNGA